MPLYEHVFLARQDLSQQQVDELTAHYKGVIEQMGGTVPKAEYWGVKSLTYRIRKNRKAHFTQIDVTEFRPKVLDGFAAHAREDIEIEILADSNGAFLRAEVLRLQFARPALTPLLENVQQSLNVV